MSCAYYSVNKVNTCATCVLNLGYCPYRVQKEQENHKWWTVNGTYLDPRLKEILELNK